MMLRIHPALDLATVAAFTYQSQAVPVVAAHWWEGPVGLLIGGAGFAIYWVVKAVVEAKVRPAQVQSDAALPQLFGKLQEVLDAVRANQEVSNRMLEKLDDTLVTMNTSINSHDLYVKEHVTHRGAEIARELGGSMAPLVVNAIRGAFEDNRTRTFAAHTTDKIPAVRPRARKRK